MSLIDTIRDKPQDLLIPNAELEDEARAQIKSCFDPIAAKYSIFDKVHVDGLDAEQVWAQAQMVVDGVVNKLLEEIPSVSSGTKRKAVDMSDDEDDDHEEEFEEGDVDENMLDGIDQEDYDSESSEEQDEDEDEKDEQEKDDDDDDEEEDDNGKDQAPGTALNDKFFNIDDFNQQVLAMEQQDDDEDDGVDYWDEVPDEESADEELHYTDFFDPVNKQKKAKVQEPEDDEDYEGLDLEMGYGNVEHAMESARHEMLGDDNDDYEDEQGEEPGNEQGEEKLSKFEQQQREIMQQIQDLEEENVGEKHWAQKGEASKTSRPHESLLFEDLGFERSSKPAPVITQDVTESLEEMIKRRVKNEDFDDIPRRLPNTMPEYKPSRDVTVQETKSQKSLAELYEDDYRKKNDSTYKDGNEEQLEAAHQEVVDLFNNVAFKLDALCSWNYTPKAPKPTLSIRSNAASISMEDAQPTASNESTMLAPQEVYQPGQDSHNNNNNKQEIIARNNMPVAKAEMSREERKRERKRNRGKQARANENKYQKLRSQASAKSGGKADVLQTLKKGNVSVVGKHGEKRDVDGKLRKDQGTAKSTKYKL